jgi:hypothetical protein
MFIRGKLILLVYIDDCITICPGNEPVPHFIESMQSNYILIHERNILANLGIQVECKKTHNRPEYH